MCYSLGNVLFPALGLLDIQLLTLSGAFFSMWLEYFQLDIMLSLVLIMCLPLAGPQISVDVIYCIDAHRCNLSLTEKQSAVIVIIQPVRPRLRNPKKSTARLKAPASAGL